MAYGCHNRIRRLLLVVTLATAGALRAQLPTPDPHDLQSIPETQNTVEQVVHALESHTLTPAQALDPTLDAAARRKQLRHFRSSAYSLTIEPAAPVANGSEGFASMQASFRLRDGMMTTTRSGATLQFVQRGDRWYFADYNFLDVSGFIGRVLTGVVVIAALVGWLLWFLLRRARTHASGVGATDGLPGATAPGAAAGMEYGPQGLASGALAPQMTAPGAMAGGRSSGPANEGMREQTGAGVVLSADARDARSPGWHPEIEPTHPQTQAYPVAPPHYEVDAPPSTQTTAYPVPPPTYEPVTPVSTQTTAYPAAPAAYEASAAAAPQTTAYPVPPPVYEADAVPVPHRMGPEPGSRVDPGEPESTPKA